jgi:tetratricopeptide (TPR) repeat protein
VNDQDTPNSRNVDSAIAAEAALHGASREAAAVLIAKQSLYLDLQIERMQAQDDHIEEEQRLHLSHLRLRRFSDYAKMMLEIAVGLFLLVVIGAIGTLVWQAREAKGLVVEPLHTPADMAARGLDGTVLSRRMLDKLNALVAESDKWSLRAASTISGNWGDDSKVEIPNTGVSIGELSTSLRRWLGQETRVSGEIFRTDNGIAITVRSGSNPGVTLYGSERKLDDLLARAALALFRQTQPLRLITGTFDRPHAPAELEFVRRLAETGPATERLFAWSTLSQFQTSVGDFRGAEASSDRGIAVKPRAFIGYADRNAERMALGHLEGALADVRKGVELLESGDLEYFSMSAIRAIRPNLAGILADLLGAYGDAVRFEREQSLFSFFELDKKIPAAMANDLALDHDPRAAAAILAAHRDWNDAAHSINLLLYGPILPEFFTLSAKGEWKRAAASLHATDATAQKSAHVNDVRHTFYWPWLAYAWAKSGNLKGAQDLIALTPHDCTLCLQMRGRIVGLSGNYDSASYWLDRAVKDAPSVPFAMASWGEMLLRKGDFDGAIAKFTIANQKGPHFADPLEMWGEALMLKNRSDLALTKFEEANRYAPNWGRLHLKWGEALGYLGRKDEARAQYRIASHLELSTADKAELSSVSATHG